MGRSDARHWLPVALVLAVLAAAGVVLVVDPPADERPDTPAAVPPPEGLDLPALTSPDAVADPAAGSADPAKVRRAIVALLDDADLGRHVLATVAGLDGTLLYTDGTGDGGPGLDAQAAHRRCRAGGARAATTRSPPGSSADGAAPGRAGRRRRPAAVGGTDRLAAARPRSPARPRLHAAPVRVGYDTSLFTGPEVSPRWPDSYVADEVVAPIQPLWVDEGRDESGYGRVDDPALTRRRPCSRPRCEGGRPGDRLAPSSAGAPATADTARRGRQRARST